MADDLLGGSPTDQQPTNNTEVNKPDVAPSAEPPKDQQKDGDVDDKDLLGDDKEGDKEPPKPAPKAPEKYETFKLPEGMTLDAALADEFGGVAKELDLSQEGAQKLVDLQAKLAAKHQGDIMASFEKIKGEWREKTISMLGNDYKEKLGVSAKVIDRYLDPAEAKEFRQYLSDSGAGLHPLLNKLMYSIGKGIQEDSLHEGGRLLKEEKSLGELFYPNMKPTN